MKWFLVFNEMDQIKVNRVGGEVVNLIFFLSLMVCVTVY